MKRAQVGGGALALLVVASVGVGQHVVTQTVLPPCVPVGSTPQVPSGRPKGGPQAAIAQRNLEESLRYKGNTVVPDRDLDADDALVKRVCELLTQSDFIPEQRLARYAGLDPKFTVVGWNIIVEDLIVRENDSSVRVRVSPRLVTPGDGAIICISTYRENYHIAGGKSQFVGGEPLPEDPEICIIAH